MSWIDDSVKAYYNWLEEKTVISKDEITGWSLISTPFIGLFNDSINIYTKEIKDGIVRLSDDGETLANLELSGLNISRSPKRKDILETIKRSYGISIEEGEIYIDSKMEDFAQNKHNFISAIMEISDLNVLANHTVASMFTEDVRTFLDKQKVISTPHFIIEGTTRLNFTFDFLIASFKQEIVLRTFNSLNTNNVPNFLFSWEDVKGPREAISGKELKGLVIVNDEISKPKTEFLDAIKSKGADYILWSDRHSPDNIKKIRA